jgi:hypothetical protein
MKKIYLAATAALLCSSLNAQIDSVTFESFSIGIDGFDNGSAGNGNFQFYSINFSNFYDDIWGSWNGFSISNVSDNTTPGWGNQYASYTGSGKNSSNYSVYYPEGQILAQANAIIDSFYITNTTFSAISMRDGDAYSKQFGSVNGADGNPDGTNGEDYFRVWVIGTNFWTNQSDSIEVYLADFRFPDNNQDYILDKWLKVDVSQMLTQTLSFRFESSDIGAWGINTPTYFALDNLYYSLYEGIDENQLAIEVFPNPMGDYLQIKGEEGLLSIKDMNGATILKQNHQTATILNTSNLPSGVYFLELVNSRGKSTQRIIK